MVAWQEKIKYFSKHKRCGDLMDIKKVVHPKCIFCGTTDSTQFNTKEHIIPESLIGETYALLPDGLYCDSCQNLFGSSIEQQALGDYPFINFRVLFSVPTKKRKTPWMETIVGKMHAGGNIGIVGFEENDSTQQEEIKSIVLPAFSRKPNMVLRMLLKIGIEVIAASQYPEMVFDQRYDAARHYALTGEKNSKWFYIVNHDSESFNRYIKSGQISIEEWHSNIYAYIKYEAIGVEILYLRILYLDFIVPLTENVLPDEKLIHECNNKEPLMSLVYV
jgi:hypothetical protein